VRLLRPLLISLIFGLLGLGTALVFGQPEDLLVIRNLSVRTLLWSLLLLAVSFLCGGLRVQLLARTLGYRVRLASAVRSHVLGLFSAAVTPSGSGNAPAIALMLRRDGLTQAHAWSVGLYTGVVDLLFFAWGVPLALLTLKLTGQLPDAPWLLAGGLAVSVLFSVLWYGLAFHLAAVPRLVEGLFRWRPLRRYRGRAERFAETLTETVARLSATTWYQQIILQLLAVGLHVSVFAMFLVIAAELGLTLAALPTLATLFLVFVLSHVVPTPGGSGFLELTLPLLLNPERPAAVAPAVLVWRLVSFYSVFLLGPSLGGAALARRLGAVTQQGPPYTR
jgi:uncharacterized protein (TIRG00374 family)